MRKSRRLQAALTTAFVTMGLVLTGCSNSGEEYKNVQIATEDETKQAVTEIGQQIATVAGGELKTIGVDPTSCTSRNGEASRFVYYVQGTFQVFVPEERHAAILAELRQNWQQQGYKQLGSQPRAPQLTSVEVRSPDDFEIIVDSTKPPTALYMLIHSPCRRSPTRRD